MPVVDDENQLVGVVSEADVLHGEVLDDTPAHGQTPGALAGADAAHRRECHDVPRAVGDRKDRGGVDAGRWHAVRMFESDGRGSAFDPDPPIDDYQPESATDPDPPPF
jgi:hypothetical protein